MTLDTKVWDPVARLATPLDIRTIVDGGANIGDVTTDLLSRYPHAHFHCFEPSPATFSSLSGRFANHANVTCIEAALAETSGTLPFHIGAAQVTSSLYPRNTSGRRYFKSDFVMVESIEARTMSLDAYCAAAGIDTIDILKLDTQGGEYAILKGAAGLLSRQAVNILVAEFFIVPHYEDTPLLNDIWNLLRSMDYGLFDLIPSARAANGQLRYGDAIFVSGAYRRRHLDSQPPEP